ncbi:hypothetical protein Lalb_Chr02g0157131 [Lupinus albus]|uniref:Uncharacterized protein n=1 Tax=Lupinus albus TaxID=3870 RepID=A0A6A4R2I8_LUPAL|nr:hypothetical protein Lalb_Chr02g0157131 [Lupinus albus]
MDKEALAGQSVIWVDIIWKWSIPWRREHFQCEKYLIDGILKLISPIIIQKDIEDQWIWPHDMSNIYTIKSTYKVIWQKGIFKCRGSKDVETGLQICGAFEG